MQPVQEKQSKGRLVVAGRSDFIAKSTGKTLKTGLRKGSEPTPINTKIANLINNDKFQAMLFYLSLSFVLMVPILGPGYYLSLDMQFGPNSFSSFQFPELYGFLASPYGGYLPLKMAFAALSTVVPIDIIEKAILFGILFLCGISIHLSLPRELGSSRYLAGLFYVLNPFVFLRFIVGHWYLLLSYSIWPIAINRFRNFLENPGNRDFFTSSVLLTAAAGISSHGLALLLMAYAIILISRAFVLRSLPSYELIVNGSIMALAVLAINLFWILPTVLQFGSSYSPASVTAYLSDFGAQGMDLPLPVALLTLYGFWRGGVLYTKDVFSLWYVPYAFLFLLMVIGFFYLLRPTKAPSKKMDSTSQEKILGVSLLAIFAAGFLLAMGSSSPLFGLISFLGDKFPLYFIFRDTQKFIALLPLAYSTFLAYGLHYLRGRFPGVKALIISISIIAVLIHNYGFFGLLGQIGPTQYPTDWKEADAIISADSVQGNVLILPSHLYYVYNWANSFQKTIGNPAEQFFSKPILASTNIESGTVQSDVNDSQQQYFAFLFHNRQFINDTAELLLPINVRYVIILKTDEDAIHYLYMFQRRGGVQNITLVYESQDIYLFRNDLSRGPLMASADNGAGSFDAILNNSGKGIYSEDVSYSMVNPAVYEVNSSSKPYVVFTPESQYLDFAGTKSTQWHGLASFFGFTSPGTLTNSLFYLSAALLLLSWFICILLVIRTNWLGTSLLLLFFGIIFILVAYGVIGPPNLGALIIISILLTALYQTGFRRIKMLLNVI